MERFTFKQWTFWGLQSSLLLVLFTLVACQTDSFYELEQATCSAPSNLKTYLEKKQSIHGCLVAFWENQPVESDYNVPLIISSDGTYQERTENGGSGSAPKLVLPTLAQTKAVQFRIYILAEKSDEKVANNLDEHKILCKDLAKSRFNCFAKENKDTCWYALQLQPKATSNNYPTYSLGIEGEKNCRVCQREICGDNKDNNCDGNTDEYDEINDAPCSGTP